MAKRKIIKIDEALCNGCGLCIPNCREGAIRIIDGKARLVSDVSCDGIGACLGHCPQGAITLEEREAVAFDEEAVRRQPSQWPVQLRLVSPQAPFLAGSDLLVCADCVPFACADFHSKLLKGKALLVACPKLDDPQAYTEKVGQIIAENDFKSIVYARMEVPCCAGLATVIKKALISHGKTHIPFHEEIISMR